MTDYVRLLDLAAGAVLLTAVLIVARQDLPSIIRLLAAQGAMFAGLPLIRGIHDHDLQLLAVGIRVFGVRAVLLPWLLSRAAGIDRRGIDRPGIDSPRDTAPLINTSRC